MGKARAEREVLLFQKLLLILKKKDTKRYSYKGHLLVRQCPQLVFEELAT